MSSSHIYMTNNHNSYFNLRYIFNFNKAYNNNNALKLTNITNFGLFQILLLNKTFSCLNVLKFIFKHVLACILFIIIIKSIKIEISFLFQHSSQYFTSMKLPKLVKIFTLIYIWFPMERVQGKSPKSRVKICPEFVAIF